MERTKRFVLALSMVAISAAGCKSCGDQPNNDNNTNSASNNGTNSGSNNGTNNTTSTSNNNMTTIVECTTTEPLVIPDSGDVVIQKGEGGVCYSSGDIIVRGRLVTIEPGVVIEFEENAVIKVEPDGKLNMVGTEADPIILTGERQVPGYWAGIWYDRTNSIDNVIDWVVIQYAGRDQEGALKYTTCCGEASRLEVSNSIFEFGATLGVFAGDSTTFALFENNTMRNNVEGAASVHAATLSGVGPGNSFTGNDVDVVFTGGRIRDGELHSWLGLDVPLQVTEDIDVDSDSGLSIGAGSTLQFEEGLGINIAIGSSFSTLGEAGNEVLLTGTEQIRGHWTAIQLDRSNFEENMIAYTTIEYAGKDEEGAIVFSTCCGAAGQLSFSNSTIRESLSYGLVLAGVDISMPTFENVTLTANTLGAMKTDAGNVAQIVAGDFTGNDIDIVEISGGRLQSPDTVWVNPGIPFRVSADLSTATMTTLTLEAGTEFEFESGISFSIASGGGISAVGTAADPIIFRGAIDQPDVWEGISMDRAEWVNNALDYVEIANAGAGTVEASLELTSCCGERTTMTIDHLTIRTSSKPAFQIPNPGADPDLVFVFTGCANLTFTDTGGGVVQRDGTPLTIAEFQALCQ